MRKHVLWVLFSICVILPIYPQGLKNWVQQKEEVKEPIDRLLYSHSIIDGKVVINGVESFEGLSDETVFLNALLWAINQNTKLKEELSLVDYKEMRFVLGRAVASSEPTTNYLCKLFVQISGSKLTFLVSEIVCESVGILGLKRAPFEKLNPEKKAKHSELLKEFVDINSKQLNELFHFIRTNQLPSISHWNEIAEGKVIKGMNKVECLLAYGKPIDVKTTGDKEQWMYNSFSYLFFENGILDTFVK